MKSNRLYLRLDKIGMTASVLCAVHCAIVPVILTTLPFWGISFLADNTVEITMILVSLGLGITSLGTSYIRDHRKTLPIVILILGFIIIGTGHFLAPPKLEMIVVPAGGFIIAVAHFFNWRYLKSHHLKHDCTTHSRT